MSKKKKQQKHGRQNQQNQIQETTTTNAQSKARTDVQSVSNRDVCAYTDCAYYRENKPLCALGVAPTHCDACSAYITLQIIKKKKDEKD